MNLKDWMEQAKAERENGKSLLQLLLQTYIKEKLGFEILEVKLINKGYEDEFRFVAANGVNQYIFESQYYEPQDFTPHQQILTLKEIRGKEGVLTCDRTFWLTKNNRNDKFLSSPLSELLSGKQNDQELQYVVDYLTNAFKDVGGYCYTEEEDNDLRSFVISLNGHIKIRKAFSNTIQCDFHKERYSSIQIIFKERERKEINRELDEFITFAHAYLEKNMKLDQHDLSSLYDFFDEEDLAPQLNTSALLSSKELDAPLLFKPIVVETDDMFSYHQVEIRIYYLIEKESFIVETNYLFRTFAIECMTTDEVKNEVKNIIQLVQSTK